MIRSKLRKEVALTATTTPTDPITINGFNTFVLEVPDADKAKAVTIQTLSGVTGQWEDVVTLANTTTKYKPLSATEQALVGPLEVIRLKFASAPAAASKAVLHLSS